ncbi:MAG TPA: branched-chain amino acid ABC transporter permease [Stellaceae bacterium]|jgi:branched-chain amino acid transport system permease protein
MTTLPAPAKAGLPLRSRIGLGLFVAAMLAAPFFVGDYVLSVLIIVLFSAYLGQAWNIMMGFAGQLSIGHALYVGLGAYASAALFVHFGLPPWIGMLVGVALATLVGSAIGALGFRFGVQGVYFALLTIAFAEFTRVLFDHFDWVGGSGGLFLPVTNRSGNDLVNLRGSPVMFYYLLLAMTLGVLALCRALLRRRIGYYWLAIREDQDAAQAAGIDVFRCKVLAVALSAGLTAVAGVLQAFYNNNLYPETTFATGRSVEIMLAPIIGGLGTLFGPILGAFALTALGEGLTTFVGRLAESGYGLHLDGLKPFLYGLTLVLIIAMQPTGLWPWLCRLGASLGGRNRRRRAVAGTERRA